MKLVHQHMAAKALSCFANGGFAEEQLDSPVDLLVMIDQVELLELVPIATEGRGKSGNVVSASLHFSRFQQTQSHLLKGVQIGLIGVGVELGGNLNEAF